MPIEIRELHIKVSVTTPAGGGASGTPGPASADVAGTERRALIAECVEQVLQVLRDQKER